MDPFARIDQCVLAAFGLIWTEATAAILLYLVAAWALIIGMFEVVGAVTLDHSNEWLLRWSGVASIMFAVLVFLFPKTGGLSVTQMISRPSIN